jgi:acetyl/propionyl-CoA carboxylase alpha subunit
MVAKLVVWGSDRDEAIRRTQRALLEYRIRGIATNTAFFRLLLRDEDFQSGVYHTGFLTPERMEGWPQEDDLSDVAVIAAAIATFEKDHALKRSEPDGGTADNWRWSLR